MKNNLLKARKYIKTRKFNSGFKSLTLDISYCYKNNISLSVQLSIGYRIYLTLF